MGADELAGTLLRDADDGRLHEMAYQKLFPLGGNLEKHVYGVTP